MAWKGRMLSLWMVSTINTEEDKLAYPIMFLVFCQTNDQVQQTNMLPNDIIPGSIILKLPTMKYLMSYTPRNGLHGLVMTEDSSWYLEKAAPIQWLQLW